MFSLRKVVFSLEKVVFSLEKVVFSLEKASFATKVTPKGPRQTPKHLSQFFSLATVLACFTPFMVSGGSKGYLRPNMERNLTASRGANAASWRSSGFDQKRKKNLKSPGFGQIFRVFYVAGISKKGKPKHPGLVVRKTPKLWSPSFGELFDLAKDPPEPAMKTSKSWEQRATLENAQIAMKPRQKQHQAHRKHEETLQSCRNFTQPPNF